MTETYAELRQKAANYYAENEVAPKLEDILNKMFFEKPNDIYGRLAEFFEGFAATPTITSLSAKKVLDGCGSTGLQCSVYATVKNRPTLLSTTEMSLEKELTMLPFQQQFVSDSQITSDEVVERCCTHIVETISEKLNNVSLIQQEEVDQILKDWINDVEYDKFVFSNHLGDDDDDHSRTPTPSSGKKKKAPSAKGKAGKAPDKPVPPKEAMENRLKGCSAVSLVSVAVLNAAASFLRKPAFEHLRHTMSVVSGTAQECEKSVISMPTTAITVMSGGKAAPGKLNLVKSVFAIANPGWTVSESMTNLSKVYQNIGKNLSAKSSSGLLTGASGGFQPSYDKPEQPLDATIEAITSAGFTPGQDVFLGIDCSAHDIFDYDKGKYDISTGALKTADEMVDLYKDLVSRYPSLIMLVDPVRKEDREQWSKLCEVVSEKCFVIGSDAVYGSLHSVNDSILSVRRSSGLVISSGSRITCSDLARVVGDVRSRDCVTMLVSPAGDVCDDIFADLAVGLGTTFVRFGAPSRGENTSKINRLVEIERMLKEDDTTKVSYMTKFDFPVIKPPPAEPASDDDVGISPEHSSPDQKKKK